MFNKHAFGPSDSSRLEKGENNSLAQDEIVGTLEVHCSFGQPANHACLFQEDFRELFVGFFLFGESTHLVD